jgi:hypothetical protein
MTSTALFMYLSANLIVAGTTAYFFWKVLKTPPKTDDEDIPVRKTFDAT